MKQSTSFAQGANNLLNVLQGYSKTIRLLLVMFVVLSVSTEAWGALSSPYTCTFTTNLTLSNNQVTTGDVTWTLSTTIGQGNPATSFGNTNGQSAIKLGGGKSNYYSKMTLTTSAFSTYNVSKVVLYISSNNGGSKTITVTQGNTQIGTGSQKFTNSTWVTNCTRNTTKGSGGDLSIEISSDATATFIHSISVTYETAAPACTPITPSLSYTPSSLSVEGTANPTLTGNTGNGSVTYSSSNTSVATVNASTGVVTAKAAGTTIITATIAANNGYCEGTAPANVTVTADPYTVTLDAGSGTCAASVTETSAGAGVTLPTPTLDCGDWEFAGWAIASVDTKTETEPTLIAAGAYSPTSDITLYAVYSTQEAGDAFTGYAKVATAPDDWSGKYLLSTGSYTATGEYSDKHLTCTNMAPGNVECSSQEFTLSKVGDIGYSILMPNGDYLGYSSSTNFASSSAVPTTTSTNYLWTPSTKGISNVSATARKISTNDANTDFRPYSNPSSGIVYLYKRVGGSSTTYYHSTPDCGIIQPRGSLTY